MKKILFLGAALHQTSIIKKAKERGLYVITCDNRPYNPGHRYADKTYNVSTVDRDGILEVSKAENIDGIVAYASDASAPTAAYVSENLGLSTSPLSSVEILTNKDRFRQFLRNEGLATPKFGVYFDAVSFMEDIGRFEFPIVIKPVDSSGSRGVNRITDVSGDIEEAITEALKYSLKGKFIVEEFVKKKGYQISGDAFSVDGKLRFWSFGNEYCIKDKRLKDFIPMGECWPSDHSEAEKQLVVDELQRIISTLRMGTNAYNVEAMIGEDGRAYIMELGPRNGGSMIPEVIEKVTGVDLMEYTIRAALGENCEGLQLGSERGFWANYNIPSFKEGRFRDIHIDDMIKPKIVDFKCNFKKGENVPLFQHYHSNAVGLLLMNFESCEEMHYMISQLTSLVDVEVD